MALEKKLADKPWIAVDGIRRMDRYLMPHHRVFEWGSGSSTIWLAARCKHVVSVESDEDWFELVTAEAERRGLVERIDIVLTDTESDLYAGAIDIYGYLGPFDLIFIDGKSGTRLRCARRALLHIKDRGLIVFDNAEANSDSMALFKQAGWMADRFSGKVYDPRIPEERWGTTEIAFLTKPRPPEEIEDG